VGKYITKAGEIHSWPENKEVTRKRSKAYYYKNRALIRTKLFNKNKAARIKLAEEQNHRCAICFEVFEDDKPMKGKGPCIDHCHTTGKIRGLLCRHCNLMLGLARDNTTILESSIVYLNRFKG
jgi:hypothetical protein